MQHKSEKGRGVPVVMETKYVLVTLPSLWQALLLQRQVKWKTANSHSLPVSYYIWTLLPPLYLSFSSHLLFAAPKPRCLSPVSSKKPQHKLQDVVYSAQTASSWGSGVPESLENAVEIFFEILPPTHNVPLLTTLHPLKKCMQMCECSWSFAVKLCIWHIHMGLFFPNLCREHFKEKCWIAPELNGEGGLRNTEYTKLIWK